MFILLTITFFTASVCKVKILQVKVRILNSLPETRSFFPGMILDQEKLSLRGREPQRAFRTINDYIYKIKDNCTDDTEYVHISRLTFCFDDDVDKEILCSLVFQFETCMVILFLARLSILRVD